MNLDASIHSVDQFSAFRFIRAAKLLRIAALVLLLVGTSRLGLASDKHLEPNPCKLSDEQAAALNGDSSTDVEALHRYQNGIARMLREEEFEKLDCLADHVRSAKERFSGGPWKLHVLYAGLYLPVQYPQHSTEEDWNILLQHLRRWVADQPKSTTARVALAWAYLQYAWDARGDGYANSVSESGWKLFEERTAEARTILEDASHLPERCPEWYLAMQKVAENESWDKNEARALFEQAFKFEPEYYYYARLLAYYLLPKWSGNPGDTEVFTQEIANRVGGDAGDILYFRVATYVLCGCSDDPHLSWPRILKGFEASERQFGTSMLELNTIAYLASHYRNADAVTADKAITRIGEQWDEETWHTKNNFDHTKRWAATNAPIVAKRIEMETAALANVRTPEGARYANSLEKPYNELLGQCVRIQGGPGANFRTLISVGQKGNVEDVRIYSNDAVAVCVYQKLYTAQQENISVFPAPPQAPYWVMLGILPGEASPVVSK